MSKSKFKFLTIYIISIILLCSIFYGILNLNKIMFALSPVSSEHKLYLERYGWHIKRKIDVSSYTVTINPTLEQLNNSGLDLRPYNHKTVSRTKYLLMEKEVYEDDVGKIYMYVYEFEDDIIGAVGHLDNWTPGNLSLFDKEKLIQENRLK